MGIGSKFATLDLNNYGNPLMAGTYSGKRPMYWTVFIFLVCCCNTAKAQNPDSLLRIVHEHFLEDTAKVRLYARASKAYRFTTPDSTISVAARGVALADKLHFDKGKAECLIYMGLGSLIKYEIDNGIRYCNEAIAIYEKTKDSVAMEPAFYYLAALYYNYSKYSVAVQYYSLSARINTKLKRYPELATTYSNMGNCYSAMGSYPEALDYFLKALKVYEQIDDKKGIALCLGNLGQVYADMEENTKAIEYVNRSLAVPFVSPDPMDRVNRYENAGGVYLVVFDHADAEKAFKEALRIADSARLDGSQIDRILCNLGEVYVDAKKYDSAAIVYQRCLADAEISFNPAVYGLTLRGMGKVLVATGKLSDGIDHLNKAMEIFIRNDLTREVEEAADDLRKAYEQAGNTALALRYTKMYYDYRDTLYNEKKDRKVQQLQYEYELEKKQHQIGLLNRDKTIANTRMWALISGLGLLLVIIILLYRSRQNEQHTRKMIAKQARDLDELNRFKDKIFSVLSHDLSGPIHTLSATMNLLEEELISIEEFNELKPEVNRQLNSITFLLDNLLNWSKSYLASGAVSKRETLDLFQIVADNINLGTTTASRKKIAVVNNVSPGITAVGDMGQIDIVVRNLLSNALKFTPSGGSITVSAVQLTDTIKLSVADTGRGMDTSQVKKLFTTATDNSTFGTAGEKGIGLGLLLCYEFVKANGGTISVVSEPGKGSAFTIELPKE